MSRHNYTNPAFCQQSEFYPNSASARNQSLENAENLNEGGRCVQIQRSASTRSVQMSTRKYNGVDRNVQQSSNPPKPGPKPAQNRKEPFEMRGGSGRYALVPVEELSITAGSRYAIVSDPQPGHSYSKSQDNIDRYSHLPAKDEPVSFHEEPETFKSLPPIIIGHEENRLKSAFSSDFGSKSFVLVDQKSNQRYTVVPTAEDEEIVDDNHEIIQMHNGRTHRYAIIPTEEEETCLSNSDITRSSHSYSIIPDIARTPLQSSTPQKRSGPNSYPGTPLKNPAATKKLQEILSTPRKTPIKRSNSTPRNVPKRYQSQQVFGSAAQQDLSPQKLQYEMKPSYLEARTTAVISPRVAMSCQNDDSNSMNKSWSDYPRKVANATATLGVVSLMLILGSCLNSGLCLYMIANIGRSFYLEFSFASAVAGVGLGILGFRSRHSEWLPNRSYVSGYILVTVFCLIKCCGLLILLALIPIPGTPLHDVTTGVVLGLSTFTIFFIGLGVIGSYWCYRPPPDNRVNVC